MGSLGENIPKGLVPLAGQPLLEHQLDLAHRYGFQGSFCSLGISENASKHTSATATTAA